jgi:hypothetical protein
MNEMIAQNSFIISSNLEDPYVDECLGLIKKDTEKLKKFKEIVDFYTQNNKI